MRFVIGLMIALGGCGGTLVQPGHRGLVFDSGRGGLQHQVLAPGYHRVGWSAKVIDYDVTYSTHFEPLKVVSTEGLAIEIKVAVVYRPIIAELYELETEIGRQYYDEVLGPELRAVVREEVARHSYVELLRGSEKLEDAIEGATRGRIAGKHVELTSVTFESVELPPEVVAALRARETAEQNALRAKLEAEEKWQNEKLELEHEAERRQLQDEADGRCRSGLVSK